jgi:hypothetical protein
MALIITTMKNLDSATIEMMLAAQGIELAVGRAERLAPGVNALNVDDPVGAALPFEADPTTYAVIREGLK